MKRVLRNLGALATTLTLVACGSTPAATPDGGGSQPAKDAAAAETTKPATFSQVTYLSTTPERSFPAGATQVVEAGKDYVAAIETDVGTIELDLYETDTPITVNSFVFLALHHFYEGIAFHRVLEGFMAQSGDPKTIDDDRTKWGTGGCGYQFGLEVKSTLNFDGAGVLGMARSTSVNSNGSQFFITFAAATGLNQQYTVWGKVTTGLDVLNNIAKNVTETTPAVTPTRIKEVRISAR